MKNAGRTIKFAAAGLVLGVLLLILCACGAATEQSSLWIVTEQSTWDRMNGQLEVLQKAYEAEHENVSIRVDILPTKKQERDAYLQLLRTEILRGGGPDAYLLPTGNTLILDEPSQYTYVEIEPLFPDVELAMRNGLFRDISEYYDADDALDKGGLNTAVMDAGVADGSRFVLPLRYDMPVIYAKNDALEEAGVDPAVLTQDILSIMEAVLESGDPLLAGGILREDLNVFADFIDYHAADALLDAETLSRYMADYQQLKALLVSSSAANRTVPEKLDIEEFIYETYEPDPLAKYLYPDGVSPDPQPVYYPLWIGSLQDAFDYVSLCQFEDCELSIVPLGAASGNAVATVTYYAAVGSGCSDPALAYDFLRLFLLEESQWEQNRPDRSHTLPHDPPKGYDYNSSNDLQYPGLIESGWPVRDRVNYQTLWDVRRLQVYIHHQSSVSVYGRSRITAEEKRRMRRIGRMNVDEERIPAFSDIPISEVRFNTTMSDAFADILAQLNDPDDGSPLPADLGELAQQMIWMLRWHASEG